MEIYQVGGAVRDKLLGLPIKDRDWVVVGSSPKEMEAAGYRPVGRDFPVFLHPDTHEEYALARTERKTAPGYKGFQFNTSSEVTLEEDLMRRDLTINAIAEDESGQIIDPHGGRNDLKAGILRHVSDAFVEDPVRVLRIGRLAARFNFTVAAETIALMQKLSASSELEALVAERVWTEVERALAEKHPVRFFEVLRECHALEKIFPVINNLFGVPQPEKHHPEIDSGIHTMMVLEQACKLSEDTSVRFAALVHDLGKGSTPKEEWPKHYRHEERSVELVNVLCDRYRIPNKHRELAVIVARHHLDSHRIREMRPGTIVEILEKLDAFRRPQRFGQFLLACEADARGRKGMEDNNYPQAWVFQGYLDAANAIETNNIGGEGIEFGEVIRQRRIDAVNQEKTSTRK